MTNWEERINRGGDPLIVIEHVVRYGFAGPLLSGADLWIDAACGTGYAPSLILPQLAEPPRAVLLADADESAVAAAAGALRELEPRTLVADLSTEDGLAALEAAIGPDDGGRVAITSMETVEHLAHPMRFVRWLCDQAARRDADVVLSVPNDAFWAMDNPFHLTTWGEGAFEELRRLLPDDHVAAAQFPVNGSCIAVAGGATTRSTCARTSPPHASRVTSSPRSVHAARVCRPPPAPRSATCPPGAGGSSSARPISPSSPRKRSSASSATGSGA